MPPPARAPRRPTDRRARLRIVAAVVVCGGLVALEVSRGLASLAEQRARHRAELLAVVERQHARLASGVEELLGEGREHAAHLGRSPAVHDLLRERSAERATALERLLLPYLLSFRGIDRVCVLGADGRELARCERMGGGVAALPAGLLAERVDDATAALVASAAPGEVVASRLVDDAERVEVEEQDRLVVHYAARVDEPDAPGAVVVTVYAAPVLHTLAAFAPLPGLASCVVEADGEPLLVPVGLTAEQARALAAAAGAGREATAPAGGSDAAGGVGPAEHAAVLATPLRHGDGALLVTAVPEAALAAAAPAGARLRVVLTTAAISLAIALGSASFVRAGLRARRLREAEGFLARIREESARHRALMEAAADVIVVVDPASERLLDWNPRAGELLGLPRRASQGAGAPLAALRDLLEPPAAEALSAGIARAAGAPGTPLALGGLAGRGREGARLELDARCVAVDSGGERLVEVLLSDRTHEREMELRVRTAERLSSLGLLTAGVAHEVNNPLAGIGNYLALLERPGLDGERRARYLAQVRHGFERIQAIVADLLRFARPEPREGTADLRRVVERALGLARYARDVREVDVVVEGLDGPLEVPGSEARLEQVVLNLLLNAGRASGGRGRVRVAARDRGDGRVELAVEDEGPGFAPEDLPHVFDPFFSRGEGTGLGLSVSYGIARAHGGELVAANRPGGGAVVALRLPRAAAGARRADRAPTEGAA